MLQKTVNFDSGLISQNDKKTKDIILITDNRKKNTSQKNQFRQSGFKDTEIDPLQMRNADIPNDEELLLMELHKKLLCLEKRIQQLQSYCQNNQNIHENDEKKENQKKKNRRKFSELVRNLKCNYPNCGKVYGSQTALRHHLKIKHNQTRNASVSDQAMLSNQYQQDSSQSSSCSDMSSEQSQCVESYDQKVHPLSPEKKPRKGSKILNPIIITSPSANEKGATIQAEKKQLLQ